MKSLFLTTALLLTSLNLFAGQPKVGDFAAYEFTANGMQGTAKSELTAYNASTGIYTKTSITQINGQSQTQVEQIPAGDLSSTEQLQLVINLCENPNVGGVLEQVSTPAGTFDTCKLAADGGGSVNLAVVPFGFVSVNTADLSMELVDYNFAK